MARAGKTVVDLDAAIQAYHGELKFCRAFKITSSELEHWHDAGVPREHALGLYLGLRARDCDIRPELFGVNSWADIAGVAL